MQGNWWSCSILFWRPDLTHHLSTQETDNIEGQGEAHAALAAAQQSLGDTEAALEHLKHFLDMAKQTGNLAAQSKACHSIGAIYNGERR